MEKESAQSERQIHRRHIWIAAIAVVVFVGLVLGIFVRMPLGNLIQQTPNATLATARITATATTLSSASTLTVATILARARTAHFRDMSGTETILYGDGGSTKATILLTANPLRSHETDSQYDGQGHLTEIQDEIHDGTRRYQRILIYRTNPPTDSGWKLDPQPLPDARPLNVFLLDSFTSAATLIGMETINGVSVYHLQVQLGATSKQEVWIRADNFYFVQWKATDSFSQALITMTTWDTGLSITVPSV